MLGPKTRLTAAQVGKLKRVPQFVFINCCHLGEMRPDAIAPWSKLAASLATAFIEMGSQAVIAAGWRIGDQAASIFAHSFYHAMLSGEYFGDAVRLAREAAHLQFPASNTWGAYQAHGDDRYRFPNTQSRPWQAPDHHYHGHLLADLETLHARLAGAGGELRRAGPARNDGCLPGRAERSAAAQRRGRQRPDFSGAGGCPAVESPWRQRCLARTRCATGRLAARRQRHADEHRAIDAGVPARAVFLALYHDAVRRHGSIGEPEAITVPLRFLLELLPPDSADTGLGSAVQALASQLQSSLPGISLSQAPRHNGAHSARPDSPAASS